MIRQKDADGNIVLVLTPAEAPSIIQIAYACGMARLAEVATFTEVDSAVLNDLLSGAYLLTDEQLIGALVAAHADHEGDDQEGILDVTTTLVLRGREVLVKHGLADDA